MPTPDGPPRVHRLRPGSLHSTAVQVAAELEQVASALWPHAGMRIVGQSDLRFLLDPNDPSWQDAAAACDYDHHGDVAQVEQILLRSNTLENPGCWVEQLSWTDGPSAVAVESALSETILLQWDEVTHPAHSTGRRYSGPAFTLYALHHHAAGQRLLAELGVPPLPEANRGPVNFPQAHAWLRGVDLSWLTPWHPAAAFLAVYTRMLPECVPGIGDPAVAHAVVDEGLLTVAAAVVAQVGFPDPPVEGEEG